jgi:hypothetical protein
LERSSAFLSFRWEGSPIKYKEMVRIRVDTTSPPTSSTFLAVAV